MALDEPKDDDQVFEVNDLKYVINKDLYEQVKPINVDFVETAMGSGFSIQSNLNAGASCGSSCSSSCSC
jgi:Fe-S cluster assembly iron-binding protein IscA